MPTQGKRSIHTKGVAMRVPKWLPRINGRRGVFQLLLGTVFAMLALATLIAKDYPPALAWLGRIIESPHPLAALWFTAAAAGLLGAFLPRPKDWFSFAALTFAPMVWGSLYLIGGFLEPHGTSPLGMILYWCLAGTVMVVSGMTGDRDRDEREAP